jgi:hypothetical protein
MQTDEEKSPLSKIIELLEKNGYRVFKAEEKPLAPNPRGTIEFQVAPKESFLRSSI